MLSHKGVWQLKTTLMLCLCPSRPFVTYLSHVQVNCESCLNKRQENKLLRTIRDNWGGPHNCWTTVTIVRTHTKFSCLISVRSCRVYPTTHIMNMRRISYFHFECYGYCIWLLMHFCVMAQRIVATLFKNLASNSVVHSSDTKSHSHSFKHMKIYVEHHKLKIPFVLLSYYSLNINLHLQTNLLAYHKCSSVNKTIVLSQFLISFKRQMFRANICSTVLFYFQTVLKFCLSEAHSCCNSDRLSRALTSIVKYELYLTCIEM